MQSSRTSSRRAHARAHARARAELTQSSRRAHAELSMQGVFSLPTSGQRKIYTSTSTRQHGQFPPRSESADARREACAWSTVVPPSVRSNNRRQQTAETADVGNVHQRRARPLAWISQINQRKAIRYLEWTKRFERGGISACAPLRRCAAAPLRRSRLSLA